MGYMLPLATLSILPDNRDSVPVSYEVRRNNNTHYRKGCVTVVVNFGTENDRLQLKSVERFLEFSSTEEEDWVTATGAD